MGDITKVLGAAIDIFKWGKKKVRENEVNNIDKNVDAGNDAAIADKLRSVEKRTKKRTFASDS